MRTIVSVLTLCVLLAGVVAAQAQTGSATVTADRTSVRDRAATDGAVVATVTKGESLTVLAASGSGCACAPRPAQRASCIRCLCRRAPARCPPNQRLPNRPRNQPRNPDQRWSAARPRDGP